MKILVLLFALPWGMAFAAQSCESLSKLALTATVITHAETIGTGTFTPPEGKAVDGLPSFCRVSGTIHPSADSDIQFEVWLPSTGWNGKFYGVGNGGYAGAINFGQMGAGLKQRYATASTDTGHRAGGTDATWALGHPEKITDFGYRAIHETAVKAKLIVAAFYGDGAKRSFFSSCSNGGRQALMEAQRFPEDYDGIIAGAPANYWTHLLSNAAWDLLALGSKESFVPSTKLPAIEKAALQACDALDGVKDGVIEDPAHCHFDPSVLQCAGGETDSCLTQPQLTALKKLYAGSRWSNGKQVFPGYPPGGEAEVGGWSVWIAGRTPDHSLMYAFGTQFFKNMVFQDPAWDYHQFEVDRNTKSADAKMAHALNSNDPDLSRFQARGGKLILYHGWSDAAISAQNTIDYYKSVVAKMGARKTGGFVRLYMVPGMQHCGGGPGPDSFGQLGIPMGDAGHDLGAAMDRWVEQGVAPKEIIAAKYQKDSDPASGVVRTRPLCVYPLVAHYKGSGSTDDAVNFACGAAN